MDATRLVLRNKVEKIKKTGKCELSRINFSYYEKETLPINHNSVQTNLLSDDSNEKILFVRIISPIRVNFYMSGGQKAICIYGLHILFHLRQRDGFSCLRGSKPSFEAFCASNVPSPLDNSLFNLITKTNYSHALSTHKVFACRVTSQSCLQHYG